MIAREWWRNFLVKKFQKRSILWLTGVRRVGKTSLVQMLPNNQYFNCDLPSVARRVEDPEFFFRSISPEKIIIFDEIHQLPDPSRILKIGADEFPHLKIVATGSSTLSATKKFRDSLTGRKTTMTLPPIPWFETHREFNVRDLDLRLLRGGLPPFLLSERLESEDYAEWLDSFFARDIQELYGIRERTGFLNLLRLMLRQSGGLADYSNLARECDLSRATVKAHLEALVTTHALHSLTPFSGGGRRELVKRPKIYGFDTGFVCFARSRGEIDDTLRGNLWEHLVLDLLLLTTGGNGLHYWRDKSNHEIDFVVERGDFAHVIEAKVNPEKWNLKNLRQFRSWYPRGRNIIASPSCEASMERHVAEFIIEEIPALQLAEEGF